MLEVGVASTASVEVEAISAAADDVTEAGVTVLVMVVAPVSAAAEEVAKIEVSEAPVL